ncbi:unnamed protein product [Phytophthora fragariaefolia]|uniref:Unnamed protein product n=1 Tax=Phytophthora fragariaefolia TaxID=1490495 RepID=A0A9W6YDS7_9STRA|nr:unnamed protein product [Phytophthora fragariaefolia]
MTCHNWKVSCFRRGRTSISLFIPVESSFKNGFGGLIWSHLENAGYHNEEKCDLEAALEDFDLEDNDLSDASDDSGDEEDVCAGEEGVILPREVVGTLTGIRIKTSTQIQKLRRVVEKSTAQQPQNITDNVKGMNVKAYAKRKLLQLNIGGSFGDIVTRAGLSEKMLDICKCSEADKTPDIGIPTRDVHEAIAEADRSTVGDVVMPGPDRPSSSADTNICVSSTTALKMGWARRPKRGQMYGTKYISLYENEIEYMFRQGEKDPSRKMGPARMLEALIMMYPHRYNLPGGNEIRGLITRLMKRKRQFSSGATQQTQTAYAPPLDNSENAKKKRMSMVYADFLASLVSENPAKKHG